MLALGNSLPGPIATKIAAYVGYDVYGWPGFLVALAGTIIPSAVALIYLLKILRKYKQSPIVKGMSLLVQPVIAIMMLLLTWNMAEDAVGSIGYIHSIVIAGLAFLALGKFKIHPAIRNHTCLCVRRLYHPAHIIKNPPISGGFFHLKLHAHPAFITFNENLAINADNTDDRIQFLIEKTFHLLVISKDSVHMEFTRTGHMI